MIEYDIASSIHQDFWDRFVADRDVMYRIQLSDGPQELPGRFLLVNLMLWRPLLIRNMPVREEHMFKTGTLLTPKEIARINSLIYRDILLVYPDQGVRVTTEMLGADPFDTSLTPPRHGLNGMYNLYVDKLGAFNRSISGFDVARLLQHPKMKEATTIDMTEERKIGIQAMEDRLKIIYRKTLDTVADPTVTPNKLYPFWKLGILSESQLPQLLVACGTRTDVNDRMILEPILTGYMNGLSDIRAYAIDSLSGKKSAIYNLVYMALGQYNNRKQQLLATCLRRIYPGDCGSTVTLAFEIHARNAEKVIGKYIVSDGKLVEVTPDLLPKLIGKIIHMRSVLTCRHTDGFCRVCGGRLTDYLPDGVVPGLQSMMDLMGPAAQLILSNKHVAKTVSLIYILPEPLVELAYVERNQVFFRPNVDMSKLLLGVPFECMKRIGDLKYVTEEAALSDQDFSTVDRLMLARADTGEVLTSMVSMVDHNQSTPYFSSEMLSYIKNNPDLVTVGDSIWINMAKFDRTRPVMGAVVENDSMVRFTKKIEFLFTRGLKRYTSATEALRVFSSDVYSKLSPHIMHLEVALRASMITSRSDYRIPVVTNPEKVMFGTLPHIIPRRSIGAQIAFQSFPLYITDPHTFVVAREPGFMDTYIGIPNGAPYSRTIYVS